MHQIWCVNVHQCYCRYFIALLCVSLFALNTIIFCIQKRLRILAMADVPITITEFSVHTNTVSKRAQVLEKAMYAFYSQPKVMSYNTMCYYNIL